jgi:putative ABC transport system permease protein
MPWLIPVTILASVVVTGIACLIPIRSATQVDPALVLKGE